AFGLKKDLSKCYAMFTKTGKIADFPVGEDDISDRFQIPEKIYGRDDEISHLMDVFKKVSGGSKELVFFSGQSGIGKTVIINEVHKPIVEKRGYFIAGKYDQFKRNIPYTSIIQAFTDLAKEIITESDEKLVKWKFEILNAVGNNGAVITDVIPSMEMIIGKQPEVQELPASEAQNRFNLVFQSFIQVFATEKHPLVLFLDDLQWADGASLKLIEVILTDTELKHLLFFGAYRDNEVDKSHPFIITLDNLKKEGLTWEDIHLKPLIENDISNILCDTLYKKKEDVSKLSEMIISKTGGNPFFVTEFLKTLYSEKHIYFQEGWNWNWNHIQKAEMTDNLIELMAAKITKLPTDTLNILKAACCVGVKSYIDTIALICNLTEGNIIKSLEIAINEGMVKQYGNDMTFVHDKVREAAYSLISVNEQEKFHYDIGKILLAGKKSKDKHEIIFNIVNQLNLATRLLTESERNKLIELNYEAGMKAKASAAYDSASEFFRLAINLLEKESWRNNYKMTLDLYTGLIETLYMVTEYSQVEKLFPDIIKNVKNIYDKIRSYEIIIDLYTNQQRNKEANKLVISTLSSLGFSCNEKTALISTLFGILKSKMKIGKKGFESLLSLPELNEPQKIKQMNFMVRMAPILYFTGSPIFSAVVMKMFNHSLKYGNSYNSAYSYMAYSLILAGVFDDIGKALELIKTAIKLAERYENKSLQGNLYFIYGLFFHHWEGNLDESYTQIIKAIPFSKESGDIQMLGYGYVNVPHLDFIAGKDLKHVNQNIIKYEPGILSLKQSLTIHHLNILKQSVLNLLDFEDGRSTLNGSAFIEDKELSHLYEVNDLLTVSYYMILKTLLFYIFNDYYKGLELFKHEKETTTCLMAMSFIYQYYFIYALTITSSYPQLSNKKKKKLLKKAKDIQKKFLKWSNINKSNYLHKYFLISAEISAISNGNIIDILQLYSKAINGAKTNNFLNEEAVSNECAARYCLSQNQEKLAATYMKEARYCYLKWGAMAKVEQLDDKYSELLASIGSSQFAGIGESSDLAATRRTKSASSSSGGSGHSGSLDLATVMKASNAISGEIEMKKLLSSMINILIENAGAQKGALILFVEDHLFIEAETNIDSEEITVLQSIPLEKGVDLSPAIVRYVAKTKESIVLDNASEDTSYSSDSYIQKEKPLSILCTPIVNQGRLTAVLYLENNLAPGVFTPERVEILKVLSSQAAISIENARLIENLSEQERLKKEMEIAERIQTSLCPPSPDHAEFEIAAAMKTAEEVGGDYYDIVEDATGALWFAIGDVSGHGVTPGLIMMMAETAFGSNVEDSVGVLPGDIIKRMNRILCKNIKDRLKESHFMTMNLLKHLGDGRFVHSGAHLDIIVYRAEAKRCELFETGGLFLGMIPDISHAAENSEFKMEKGDILIVYTDGVTEAANKEGKLLDPDGLCTIIEKNVGKGVNGLCSSIVSETLDWCNHKQADDITLIVAKRK
ncbi:MAG: AAA family ATPase, partial [Deltaproteobacteria bacterium]|nr:AAA family ATPase [Deltaproteobacteria bacterium]